MNIFVEQKPYLAAVDLAAKMQMHGSVYEASSKRRLRSLRPKTESHKSPLVYVVCIDNDVLNSSLV